jgi:hypothetical protein
LNRHQEAKERRHRSLLQDTPRHRVLAIRVAQRGDGEACAFPEPSYLPVRTVGLGVEDASVSEYDRVRSRVAGEYGKAVFHQTRMDQVVVVQEQQIVSACLCQANVPRCLFSVK